MNIIDLRPIRIVMHGDQAYLLPYGNGRYPGKFVIPGTDLEVPFHGCWCEECVGEIFYDVACEALVLLRDRGFRKIHIHFYVLPEEFEHVSKNPNFHVTISGGDRMRESIDD